jgi:hypothetical protein
VSEGAKERKVSGLRWNTEKAKVSIDVKVSYCKKKKGAYTEDDVDLSFAQQFAWRALWRSAQSQLDHLRLLWAYVHGEMEAADQKSHNEGKLQKLEKSPR